MELYHSRSIFCSSHLRGVTDTPVPVPLGLWRPLRLSTVGSSSSADDPNLYSQSREERMCVQTKPGILLTCTNRPTIPINAIVSLIVRTGDQAGFHSWLLPPRSSFYNVGELICFQLAHYPSKFVFVFFFCCFFPEIWS